MAPQRAHELIATELAARPRRHEQAQHLAGCRRLLVVGSGVDEVTAAELALKLEEAIHVPTTPLGAEKVLHGHLPAADRDTGLVLLRFDPDHRDVVALQLLTLELCLAVGTKPDLIRREQPLYRRVADAAGAG